MSSGETQAKTEVNAASRYDSLKQASLDHYRTGISLKNAAKKYNVGIRELKDFYENEAGEFLKGENSDESSEEDFLDNA